MRAERIADLLAGRDEFAAAITSALEPGQKTICCMRPTGAIVIAKLLAQAKIPLLLLVSDENRAEELVRELELWAPRLDVLHFPAADHYLNAQSGIDHAILANRSEVLKKLTLARLNQTQSNGFLVIASARAIAPKLCPVEEFTERLLGLAPGMRIEPQLLAERLQELGYRRSPLVEEPGEFVQRGGLVDFFPPEARQPIRVDFFDDEIESLRHFAVGSQRSEDHLESWEVGSATEYAVWSSPEAAARLSQLDASGLRRADQDRFAREIALLEHRAYFDAAPFLLGSTLPRSSCLLDYAAGLSMAIEEPDMVRWSLAEYCGTEARLRAEMVADRQLPAGLGSPLFDSEWLSDRFAEAELTITQSPPGPNAPVVTAASEMSAPDSYGGRLLHMAHELSQSGMATILASYQGDRLFELLIEHGVWAKRLADATMPLRAGDVVVVRASLVNGWRHRSLNLQLLTDSEIFGRQRRQKQATFQPHADEDFLLDLSPGELVVHVEQGIGRYQGVVRLADAAGDREYLQIIYAQDAKLYVPVEQMGRIQRYVAAGEATPKLSRLGTADWNRAKAKATKAARDIAGELLEIYAARETSTGHRFGPDSDWQVAMEQAFPFVETPDQLSAIEAVKADMEADRPMDRLICGDVGFGKTEVAVRASFKAAHEGKQVAVLVPTTILAQQHFDTFGDRLQQFPMRVAMLSRFQTPAEQKRVVSELAAGSVDVVIGTHRLLSRDIKFADLGLVVIDEEQRFGVSQKEKLKQLRAEVDILTLTATPIPRTLHMALTEVRDISVIESPPHNRRPVKSYVTGYSEVVVREAIESELARGGQVFFVHNRVNSIHGAAARVRKIFPAARVAVAHGQMPVNALESTMVEFASGQSDVLVCTAIIENGVDLPNVNTLIVDECWMFGLAQLYQLRGRVGRSATQAYAYFLYSREDRLTESAQHRLQAVLEANDLGAGLRLAMRDLQIRGAGDMLGANQSGFANSVGLYMYLQMVRDAVRESKKDGSVPERKQPITPVDLPLAAYIPDEYAGTYAAKLREYQRLVRAISVSDVEAVADGLRERFGEFPEAVANLVYVARVRARATALGIDSIATTGGDLSIRIDGQFAVDRNDLRRTLGWDARVGQMGIVWPDFESAPDWRDKLLACMERLAARQGSVNSAAAKT